MKNNELLEEIYKNAEMGSNTPNRLMKNLKEKENRIKKVLEAELKEYEDYAKKAKEIIKIEGLTLKQTGLINKLSANMGIDMEVIKDNSDAAIAHMLIEGLTMGVVDMTTKIKNDDSSSKEVKVLAKNFLEFQQREIEKLKKYL